MDKETRTEFLKLKQHAVEICRTVDIFIYGHRTPITELGLSTRALNCLYRHSIEYVEHLVKLEKIHLHAMRNMGSGTMNEIIRKVNEFGFKDWLC